MVLQVSQPKKVNMARKRQRLKDIEGEIARGRRLLSDNGPQFVKSSSMMLCIPRGESRSIQVPPTIRRQTVMWNGTAEPCSLCFGIMSKYCSPILMLC